MATSATEPEGAPERRDLIADAAIAAAVFAGSVTLLAVGEADDGDGLGAVGVLLAALTSLPLLARRRAPVAVFAFTALASVALRLAADPVGPPLGATLALYWMVAASDESSARTRLLLALAATALAAHVAASGIATDRFPDTELLFGTLVWGAAWVAGDRTRMRRERMAALEERALRAEREAERERRLAAAEERTRIARDLHDSAGHAINTILVHAGLGRLQPDGGSPAAREAFETIEQVARETVGEIDQLVRVLREDEPAVTGDEVEAPPGLAALDALLQRHRAAGMEVTARSGELPPLPPAVDRAAYRIIQEALTNAARHGGGSARVELAAEAGELSLVVENPLGAEPPAIGGGHGITGMRERAALLGGTLEVVPTGTRFRVRARLPLGRGRQ